MPPREETRAPRAEAFADGDAIGTAVTDDEGRATLQPPRPYFAGKRIYRAEFAGDDEHAPSSAEARS